MKLGSLLGILSPGLSATGLFGSAAQSGGLGALSAMSPLAMLLLHKKKGGAAPVASPSTPSDPIPTGAAPGSIAPPQVAGPTGPTLAQSAATLPGMGPVQGITDPQRQRLAQMLLQYGGALSQNPFAQRY